MIPSFTCECRYHRKYGVLNREDAHAEIDMAFDYGLMIMDGRLLDKGRFILGLNIEYWILFMSFMRLYRL